MGFTEEEIIRARKEALRKKNSSIYDKYLYIGNERLEFTMQEIIPPFVQMMFPKTFLDLPPEFAKKMYPSELRPAVIKTNPALTVNFAFTFFEAKLPMNEVADCARYYLASMKKMYPGNTYLDNSEHFMDKEETQILGWYSFSNPTLMEPIYNIHAYTSVEGRMLYCIFHTSKERFEVWKPHVFEAFNSIQSGRGKRV